MAASLVGITMGLVFAQFVETAIGFEPWMVVALLAIGFSIPKPKS